MLAFLAAVLLAQAPPMKPCLVQTVKARCGSVAVAENRAFPNRRTIHLRVVVIPSLKQPAAPDAFTVIAGGPGGASTDLTQFALDRFWKIRERQDILLVDQRGTGGSNRLECPPPKNVATPQQARAFVTRCLRSLHGDAMQYGTRAAADDLEVVRRTLGYRRLDLYGASYGATAAQVYLKRHPASVRTITLDSGTALDVPFYGRFAVNAQRALDDVAARCAADRYCAKTFGAWPATFARLVRAWDTTPVKTGPAVKTSGIGLAGIVQSMLITPESAAAIPYVVTQAARKNYEPLNRFIQEPENQPIMYWSIFCNEPWLGLGAKGPWHTLFDGYTTAAVARVRTTCSFLPRRRTEPAAAWSPVRSKVPLLYLTGGADPQDPIANFPDLKQRFPNGRAIVLPHYGHTVAQYGCLGDVVSQFVNTGSAAHLATRCIRDIFPPGFTYSL